MIKSAYSPVLRSLDRVSFHFLKLYQARRQTYLALPASFRSAESDEVDIFLDPYSPLKKSLLLSYCFLVLVEVRNVESFRQALVLRSVGEIFRILRLENYCVT